MENNTALYGFIRDNKLKITYCPANGNPVKLGIDISKFIVKNSVEKLIEIYNKIILVIPDQSPTDEQSEYLIKNFSYYYKSKSDCYCNWYHILNITLGNINIFNHINFMLDYTTYIDCPIDIGWIYIMNLDTNCLVISRGKKVSLMIHFDILKELYFKDLFINLEHNLPLLLVKNVYNPITNIVLKDNITEFISSEIKKSYIGCTINIKSININTEIEVKKEPTILKENFKLL